MAATGERKDKGNRILIILTSAALAIMLVLGILAVPYIKQLDDPETRSRFTAWVGSLGFRGVLILFGIQVVQIIIALIPGGPVELAAGAAYGAFGGLFICLAGCVAASALILMVVRRFGTPLVARLFGGAYLEKFDFLRDTRKIENVTFILFLIPGMPKDLLTYIAGLGRIRPSRFLVIATFARMPAILTTTIMGNSVIKGHWVLFLMIFGITAAVGILGMNFRERIIGFFRRKSGNPPDL